MKAIVNSRVWVPMKQVFRDRAEGLYEAKLYNEKNCERCDFLPDRHSEMCDQCPSYLEHVKMWKVQEDAQGKRWIGVPKGDRKRLGHFLADQDVDIVDKRSRTKMRQPIKFTGKLTDAQKSAIRQLNKKNNNGILQAPPRSGKTVMAAYQICQLGFKTLVIAAQYDWLKGFYDTFMGSDHQKALTNAPDLLQPSIGFCKTVEDFHTYDVCLATYQSLGVAGNQKKKLAKVKNLFGLVVIDECHDTPAKVYSQVLLQLNSAHMIGLSGTPDRKDGKMVFGINIIGRVVSQIQVQTLVPTVKIIDTKATTTYKYKLWPYAMKFLRTHERRNALIAKHAAHDIRRGHSIVIPVASIEHCNTLVDLINDHFPNAKRPVAEAFTGRLKKVDRDRLIDDARSGKVKCIVGIRKIVQVGLNIPRWSCLYEVEPISNVPKATQETARIRTDMPGKRKPLIKIFTEDFPQSKGCFRTFWFQTVLKSCFDVSPETKQKANKFIAADRKGGGGGGVLFSRNDVSQDFLV